MRPLGPWMRPLAIACAVSCACADVAPVDHDPWKGMEAGLARVQTLQRSLRAAPPATTGTADGPALHLRYERPFRIRIQYDRRLLVADGTNLYVQEASGSLLRYALLPFTNTLDHLPPTLFDDLRGLLPDVHRLLQPDAAPAPHPWQSYAVELLPDEQVHGTPCLHARLMPTTNQPPGMPPVDAWFDRDYGLIRKLGTQAADYMAVNTPLPAGSFSFSPPPRARRMDRPDRLFLSTQRDDPRPLTPTEREALHEESTPPSAAEIELPYLPGPVATRAWSLPASQFLRPSSPDTVTRIPPSTYACWSDGRIVVLDATTGNTLHEIAAPPAWSANPDPNRTPAPFFLRAGTQGVAVVWRTDDPPSPSRDSPPAGNSTRQLTALDSTGRILWSTNLIEANVRQLDLIAGHDGHDALLVIEPARLRILDASGRSLLDQRVPSTDALLVSRPGTNGPLAITTRARPTARYNWPADGPGREP
jgi:hypothetical protein